MEEAPVLFTFFGRFHPLMVHLPIGFLTLIILYEWGCRITFLKKLEPAIPMIWLLCAISSAGSVIFGWMLSVGGGYDEETLALHKWSGMLLSVLCLTGYLITLNPNRSPVVSNGYRALVVLVALLLIFTGHLGGSLTHGSGYLFELESESPQRATVTSLDSANVYADVIGPILDSRCSGCHNKSKRKGQLILTSYEGMMKGGKSGPAIVAGNLTASELYRRITLPHDDKKFMPAEGKKTLTEEQLAMIEWWIEKGAPQQAFILSLSPEPDKIKLFEKFFNLGKSVEIIVPPADTMAVNLVRKHGFAVRPLARNSNLLEARLRENKTGKQGIDALSKISEQLIWLYLNNSNLTDDDLQSLSNLNQLRKLNLSNNDITVKSIAHLTHLTELEYLNLYNTNVSDSGVDSLLTLPNLRELYLWQSQVTTGHMEKCKTARPDIKIVYQSPE